MPVVAQADAGEDGQGLVLADRAGDLGDGFGEGGPGEGAGGGARVGQGRVFLQGQGRQDEAGGPGAQQHAGAGEFEVYVAADGADDVGQQPSGDQGAAVLGDVGGAVGVRADLVVEGADAQPVVGGVQEEAGEDGYRRAGRLRAA